jgi:hypothetical protein
MKKKNQIVKEAIKETLSEEPFVVILLILAIGVAIWISII